jgi:diguanylate cyclase (GGDEF)-like protein
MHLLKDIVIEIFKEVMAADEMVLILPRTQQDYSASSWTSASGKVERRKIAQEDPEHETLQRWLADKLKTITVSDDARQICIPIERGGARLALVLARKGEGHFDKSRLRLSTLISSHIAVAFDNARLYYIAITDELTKTFTKRHFRYCIDNAFADYQEIGNKFALLMMDLDKFKQVNDTYGHVTGDKVLQQLGDIIRQSVREEDLVFRYGGEEFAVILPATDGEGAKFVAERIRTSTESAVFESGTIDLKLTISVGLATCPDAPSVHALVVAADKALYAAKHQGRNRLVMADNTYELST